MRKEPVALCFDVEAADADGCRAVAAEQHALHALGRLAAGCLPVRT